MRIGLLSNPHSGRNHRRSGELEALAESGHPFVHLRLEKGRPPVEKLERLAARQIELLVINGGDGTVSRVLTDLLEHRIWAEPPPIAILPRGTANMTASDIGLRRGGAGQLRELARLAADGGLEAKLVRRPILRVDWAPGRPAIRGMFFGGAGIVDAIDLWSREMLRRGLRGGISHALTLGWFLWKLGTGGADAAGIHGRRLRMRLEGRVDYEGEVLLVLATTLERLLLGARPFWDTGTGPIRYLRIDRHAPGLLRHAPSVLRGRGSRALPAAYGSGGLAELSMEGVGRFTVDGEFFVAPQDHAVRITAGEQLRFVRL